MSGLTIGVDASRSGVERPTGTERYSNEVVEHLLALGDQHRWRLYRPTTRDAMAARLDAPNVEIMDLGAGRAWTHTRLAAEIRRRPPDVLFVPAHVMPWRAAVPTVVTVHDLGHVHFPDAHTLSQRMYLEITTRHHVRKAAHLIADSASTAGDLERRYGLDPARVTVVHLGVDPRFAPAPPTAIQAVRRSLGIDEGAEYLLHVGTLQPRKNLIRLIEAFARLAPSHPDLRLILAGGAGWGGEDLVGRARSLGVAGRVSFPGYVAERDLAALYSGATLVVVPSLHEGFGLPVLEAMACGAPVAASASSSLPEVTGDAAFTFDPTRVDSIAATLSRALLDPEERRRRASLGAERAAGFTWRRCAERTLAVLERVGGARMETGAAA